MGLKISGLSSSGSDGLMNIFRLDVSVLYVSLDVGFLEENLLPVPHVSYYVLQPTNRIYGSHEDGREFPDGIEVLPVIHDFFERSVSPTSSRILYSVLKWGLVLLFRNRQTVHGVLLILFAISLMVKS